MRILLVHDYGVPMGGAEVVVLQSKQALTALGHEVRLLAGTPTWTAGAFNEYSFGVAESSLRQKLMGLLHNQSARRAMIMAARDFKPDIIHYHTTVKASPAVLWATHGVPAVMTLHDYGLLYPRLRQVLPAHDYCGIGDGACCVKHAGPGRYGFELLRTSLQYWAGRRLHSYIVPSTYMTRPTRSLTQCRTITVYNGVLPQEVRAVAGTGVLFVGRLEPEKGAGRLIEAFAEVVRQRPSAVLTIVGQGSARPDLELTAHRLGLTPSVRFAGRQEFSQMARIYQESAVVVVPSLWPEPFGLIGPEAMSFGRPVIGSNRGGMQDWLRHNVNGLVADPDDVRQLAQAIIRLLSDEDLRARLSDGARRTAREFSTLAHARRLEQIYQRLAAAYVAKGQNGPRRPNKVRA